jgi:HTH-type transcriptional regulator/antitoxin HigA
MRKGGCETKDTLFNHMKRKVMAKIENEIQYEWAVKRVEELLPLVTDDTPRTDPNSIELELLSNMVADYSEEHFAIGSPSLMDVIKLRMYEMGITQSGLAQLLGISPSRVSEYLSGKSEPTLKIGREISRKLHIDANIVLGV